MSTVKINDLTNVGILTNGSMELFPIMNHESYTLFRRMNDSSYVVAFLAQTNFDDMTCSWSQGYYIKDYSDALKFFFNKVGFNFMEDELSIVK